MNTDYYLLARDEDLAVYYFVSEGSKGRIKKGVFFQLVDEEEQLYNALQDESFKKIDFRLCV